MVLEYKAKQFVSCTGSLPVIHAGDILAINQDSAFCGRVQNIYHVEQGTKVLLSDPEG